MVRIKQVARKTRTNQPIKKPFQYRSNLKTCVQFLYGMKFTENQTTQLQKNLPFWPLLKAISKRTLNHKECRKSDLGVRDVMEKFDGKQSFVIGKNIIPITPEDIQRIFGIDGDGTRPLNVTEKCTQEEMERIKNSEFVRRRLSQVTSNSNITKTCIEYALELALTEDTEKDLEDLTRLFTLYFLVNLFVPESNAHISWKYVKCILRVENIKSFNWARHIQQKLIKSIIKKEADKVAGCVMAIPYVILEHLDICNPIQRNAKNPILCMKWDLKKLNAILKTNRVEKLSEYKARNLTEVDTQESEYLTPHSQDIPNSGKEQGCCSKTENRREPYPERTRMKKKMAKKPVMSSSSSKSESFYSTESDASAIIEKGYEAYKKALQEEEKMKNEDTFYSSETSRFRTLAEDSDEMFKVEMEVETTSKDEQDVENVSKQEDGRERKENKVNEEQKKDSVEEGESFRNNDEMKRLQKENMELRDEIVKLKETVDGLRGERDQREKTDGIDVTRDVELYKENIIAVQNSLDEERANNKKMRATVANLRRRNRLLNNEIADLIAHNSTQKSRLEGKFNDILLNSDIKSLQNRQKILNEMKAVLNLAEFYESPTQRPRTRRQTAQLTTDGKSLTQPENISTERKSKRKREEADTTDMKTPDLKITFSAEELLKQAREADEIETYIQQRKPRGKNDFKPITKVNRVAQHLSEDVFQELVELHRAEGQGAELWFKIHEESGVTESVVDISNMYEIFHGMYTDNGLISGYTSFLNEELDPERTRDFRIFDSETWRYLKLEDKMGQEMFIDRVIEEHKRKPYKMLIFPVHSNKNRPKDVYANHWTVLVLNTNEGEWFYYNSNELIDDNDYLEDARLLANHVNQILQIQDEPSFRLIESQVEICPVRCPHQGCTNDCAIFTIFFMDRLARGQKIPENMSEEDRNIFKASIVEKFVRHYMKVKAV